MAEPKTEIERRLDRIESAIRYIAEYFKSSIFDAHIAEEVEKILGKEKPDEIQR